MRYELINQIDNSLSVTQQILYNRGIKKEDLLHYINLTDDDIHSPLLLGKENLKNAVMTLAQSIKLNQDAMVLVDCDCDGYTASALLINYLYKVFPNWVENHVDYIMHEGKQHGLKDCIDYILQVKPSLMLIPDASSNDYEEHRILKDNGIEIIILDHHLADHISNNAIIINNQLSDYPNKELSGVGVVWQFCRYIDSLFGFDYADQFLDLVALGLTGDMMSLKSFETRHLITKGFKQEHIKNPFIDYMLDKNSFPLSKSDYVSSDLQTACTSIGAAFFIVPFVNAVTRSGTLEEKCLLFDSMLTHKAFRKILSNKRGHKLGEKEQLILQAIRTVTNVKNRQTRAEQAGLLMLENLIEKDNMLNHKVLLFLLNPGQVPAEIRGLIANKFMAKYQRPCCLLTYNNANDIETYDGSMRGCTKTGINSFKDVLERAPGVLWVQGHDNAAGLSVQKDQIKNLTAALDEALKDVSIDPIYRVDYHFNETDNNNDIILEIANMNDYWGQDIDRSYVSINFKITDSNFKVMKGNTLKISLPHNLSIIKFNATEEQIDKFTTTGFIELNAVCKCNENNWNGNSYPQLILQDYEIIDSAKYYF